CVRDGFGSGLDYW
nr:immunoglobulin heavy chain junction region [Macaca mulatta]MOY19734.1 immunoglobulin heavy chain junction region [Macaca mulatta]MOY20269.1 immunoglobulin heavy chain junction region [Macaca mulatta]